MIGWVGLIFKYKARKIFKKNLFLFLFFFVSPIEGNSITYLQPQPCGWVGGTIYPCFQGVVIICCHLCLCKGTESWFKSLVPRFFSFSFLKTILKRKMEIQWPLISLISLICFNINKQTAD